jgi:hypothetical protein
MISPVSWLDEQISRQEGVPAFPTIGKPDAPEALSNAQK